jgi:hypothetical protein
MLLGKAAGLGEDFLGVDACLVVQGQTLMRAFAARRLSEN